ncbi:hypothetical protein CDAR_457631 [Caerostris darwini]|uniref:Uncharacterized protein n=1 Tax=Caerostris darwini TaxID=1538125 RepID=A0AAV4NF60_9ARAC|nr:hypothetical protein CDAR_457631 [Caerostris darwini]
MDENTNKKRPLGLRRHLTSARDMAADNVSIERRPQKKKKKMNCDCGSKTVDIPKTGEKERGELVLISTIDLMILASRSCVP